MNCLWIYYEYYGNYGNYDNYGNSDNYELSMELLWQLWQLWQLWLNPVFADVVGRNKPFYSSIMKGWIRVLNDGICWYKVAIEWRLLTDTGTSSLLCFFLSAAFGVCRKHWYKVVLSSPLLIQGLVCCLLVAVQRCGFIDDGHMLLQLLANTYWVKKMRQKENDMHLQALQSRYFLLSFKYGTEKRESMSWMCSERPLLVGSSTSMTSMSFSRPSNPVVGCKVGFVPRPIKTCL